MVVVMRALAFGVLLFASAGAYKLWSDMQPPTFHEVEACKLTMIGKVDNPLIVCRDALETRAASRSHYGWYVAGAIGGGLIGAALLWAVGALVANSRRGATAA